MKRYTLGLALLGLAGPVFAQNEVDVLRYSRLQLGGTARAQSIGGATTALGGDLSSLGSNPAGLGLMQRSEVTFSPGFGAGNADARVSNVEGAGLVRDSRNSLHLANLAVAATDRRADSSPADWRGGTVALGFTRQNDFNSSFSYRSTLGDSRSLFQRLREPRLSAKLPTLAAVADDVDQQFADNDYYSLDGLAYGAYLTNYDPVPPNSTNYQVTTPTSLQRTLVVQDETVLTTGSQTQFDLAYGASYRDRLYVGGAVGIVGLHYNASSELGETNDASNTASSFGSLTLRDELRTDATGINVRFGVIYRPLDWVRVGLSAQSPTALSFDDKYSTALDVKFRKPVNVGNNQTISQANVEIKETLYAYRMSTPWRLNGGAAFVIGKIGFLSADAELVDYSSARLRSAPDQENGDDYSFSDENKRISQLYTTALNLRAGGELRLAALRLRAGYARNGDPFRASQYDRTQTFYTTGLGFRHGNMTADLAGVYTTFNRVYSPYTLADGSQPVVQVDASRFSTTFTLGYQF